MMLERRPNPAVRISRNASAKSDPQMGATIALRNQSTFVLLMQVSPKKRNVASVYIEKHILNANIFENVAWNCFHVFQLKCRNKFLQNEILRVRFVQAT